MSYYCLEMTEMYVTFCVQRLVFTGRLVRFCRSWLYCGQLLFTLYQRTGSFYCDWLYCGQLCLHSTRGLVHVCYIVNNYCSTIVFLMVMCNGNDSR